MNDVNKQLLGALKTIYRGYVRTLESGRDRIVSLGGQCDPVDVMEQSDPILREARYAIAAAEQVQRLCPYCDGTGDVHSITGEWRGVCSCEAGKALHAEPVARDDLAEAMRKIVRLGDEHFEHGGSMVLRTANSCIVGMQDIANGALLAAAQKGGA